MLYKKTSHHKQNQHSREGDKKILFNLQTYQGIVISRIVVSLKISSPSMILIKHPSQNWTFFKHTLREYIIAEFHKRTRKTDINNSGIQKSVAPNTNQRAPSIRIFKSNFTQMRTHGKWASLNFNQSRGKPNLFKSGPVMTFSPKNLKTAIVTKTQMK